MQSPRLHKHWHFSIAQYGSCRLSGGTPRQPVSYLAPVSADWSSAMLHLNTSIGKSLASELSRLIAGPAVVFLEYDQAAWGYCLFEGGTLLDQFWNNPKMFETLPQECAGNVAVMSRVFGVSVASIAPYLRHPKDSCAKAFDDDKFTLADHWVRVDFMRRIGLTYPNPGQVDGARFVKIEELRR